jgi:hypothetical protein
VLQLMRSLGELASTRDRKLKEQLSNAVDSEISNIAEGFAQPTDRACAISVHLESLQRRGSNKTTARLRSRLHYGHGTCRL